MRRRSTMWPAALIIMALATPTFGQKLKPVTVSATAKPSARPNQITLIVEIRIQDGWHCYLDAGPGSAVRVTEVTAKPPGGVEAAGEWQRPPGLPYAKEEGTTLITGTVLFRREFKVGPDAQEPIRVSVKYQACEDDRCLRPRTFETTVALPKRKPSPFEPPVRLMVKGKPVNATARQMYPSPAFYDVDNDGQIELVVGDIFGSLNVYENTNQSGKGDPVWAEHKPLKTADGKKIKVSNW